MRRASQSIPASASARRIVDNLVLLKQLAGFEALGVPIAVGLSRKSMLASLTGRQCR